MFQKISLILQHKFTLIFLLMIITLGGALRFYNLGEQSYWMDEGYTINAVLSISEHGNMVLDSGQKYSCPTYCYPTAFLVKIFGVTPSTYRLLAVLAGLLFILTIFFITKKLFSLPAQTGKNIALLTSFFTTFSYYQIAWSRQARWYTLFALFFWLALYFFYQALYSEKRKYLNIFLTALFTVLSIFTHGLAYLLPVIFIGWLLIDQIIIKKKFNWGRILFILFFGTVALYLFNFISNINVIKYLFTTLQLHYVLPYYLSFYLRTYWLFIVLGLIAIFNNKYPKQIYFLLFSFGAYFFSLSFFTDIVHYRYLFHLTPVFFILGSIGLLDLHQDIKNKYGKILLWLVTFGLFATFAGGVFLPQTNYYLESDDQEKLTGRPHYAYEPQPSFTEAYLKVKAEKSPEQIIISSHPTFNKIFLNEAGYWLRYDELGFDDRNIYSQNDREFYVNAKIIDDILEFEEILSANSGFVVLDQMARERIPEEIVNYIEKNLTPIFHEKTNSYSEIWVYKF